MVNQVMFLKTGNSIVSNIKSGAEDMLSIASAIFIIALVVVIVIIAFMCLFCGEEGRSKIKKHFAWIIGGCALLGLCGTIASFLSGLFGDPSIPTTTPDSGMLDIANTLLCLIQSLF